MLVALDDAPGVVAIIATLGTDQPRLDRCLEALAAQDDEVRLAVLVVVNAARAIELPPTMAQAVAGLNLGWGGGLGFGRSLVDAPLLWLVQDDMEADPGCLRHLRAALAADESLGLVAPLVIGDDGLVPAIGCGGLLSDDLEITANVPDVPTPPDQLSGLDLLGYVPSRGMLVRTKDWDRVGGMDPRFYPVLWADVDLCVALRRGGRGFALVPEARTLHRANSSTPRGYGVFLYGRNGGALRRKWLHGERTSTPDLRIPATVRDTILVSAAGTLHELSASYAAATAARDAAVAESASLGREIADLRASTSWRMTAPLRHLTRLLKGTRPTS